MDGNVFAVGVDLTPSSGADRPSDLYLNRFTFGLGSSVISTRPSGNIIFGRESFSVELGIAMITDEKRGNINCCLVRWPIYSRFSFDFAACNCNNVI